MEALKHQWPPALHKPTGDGTTPRPVTGCRGVPNRLNGRSDCQMFRRCMTERPATLNQNRFLLDAICSMFRYFVDDNLGETGDPAKESIYREKASTANHRTPVRLNRA